MHRLLALLVPFTLLAAGCETEAAGLTIGDIHDNPSSFVGQTVTVTGEMEEMEAPGGWFTIDGSAAANDEILVYSKDAVFTEDQEVTVTGKIDSLMITEVEQELGVDFDADFEEDFNGKPYIMAESVTPTVR